MLSEGGFSVNVKRYQTVRGSEGLLALVVEFMAFNNNFLWRAVETKIGETAMSLKVKHNFKGNREVAASSE